MDGTEGLIRGQICTDTGSPIRIPVGPETLGRIINVIGEPIDERGPVNSKKYGHFTAVTIKYLTYRSNVCAWLIILLS